MKDKIQELIDFHKSAKQECSELINELIEISKKDKEAELLIAKYQEEYTWRSIFVNQLEDIL